MPDSMRSFGVVMAPAAKQKANVTIGWFNYRNI
jgi:hypothetical protein